MIELVAQSRDVGLTEIDRWIWYTRQQSHAIVRLSEAADACSMFAREDYRANKNQLPSERRAELRRAGILVLKADPSPL